MHNPATQTREVTRSCRAAFVRTLFALLAVVSVALGAPGRASAATPPASEASPASAPPPTAQRLEININGKTLPLQLGNPIDVVVGKERVLIVVQPAP